MTCRRQRGATVAEFALSVVIFFTMVFFVLEIARALYLVNTLQEVTRRAAHAATISDFSDAAVMDSVRQSAILRDSPGGLVLGDPISDAHIRIDYLSLAHNANDSLTLTPIPSGSLPACPPRARIACTSNPNGANCIRFVRVRVCAPGQDECNAVSYRPMLPLLNLSFPLPTATTIAKTESLGYQPGSTLCP